ncbi:hypothetical protein CEXT_560741 [Caerostris extrusa]|uniref:Uncharacterized protein n=1 Tax=Caerostris extrusa TaxID=172846 RepID=A0AAV4M7J6_CAEEX|nr:hypothetical protein CEXT_560741 [Caerostris extrusa]
MSIHAGVSSMMEMEVSPYDSQSPVQGRLSPAAPEQHQQTQSPEAICSTLQSIESNILLCNNYRRISPPEYNYPILLFGIDSPRNFFFQALIVKY